MPHRRTQLKRSRPGRGFPSAAVAILEPLPRLLSHSFIILLALAALTASVNLSPVTNVGQNMGGPDYLSLPRWYPSPWAYLLPLDSQLQNLRKPPVPTTHRSSTQGQAPGETAEASINKERQEIISYQVQQGDTVSGIAERFGISTETIAWANNLVDANTIKPGQTIEILPITGVVHTVQDGDTLESVTTKYKGDVATILAFALNNVSDPDRLSVGQKIIIPGGIKPKPQPAGSSRMAQVSVPQTLAESPAPGQATGGSLQWPTYGYISQYSWAGHKGIDIATAYGSPVYAGEAGRVIETNYDRYGYGYFIMLDHGNGFATRYSHLSEILVSPGETVPRGAHIGRVGTSGRVTGPHLDFEVIYNGRNVDPMNYLPR